jgi:regulator of cell morphogenesis and NO signaling
MKEVVNANTEEKEKKIWAKTVLSELVDYIEKGHHSFLKEKLPEIKELLLKVTEIHSSGQGRILPYLNLVFDSFWDEIWQHMLKEETVLFPYIRQLEAYAQGKGEKPVPPYGSVQNIVRHMEKYEHYNAAQAMEDLREYTVNYSLPDIDCDNFKSLYKEFQSLEKDLYEHIHLENNILFPSVIELEKNCKII